MKPSIVSLACAAVVCAVALGHAQAEESSAESSRRSLEVEQVQLTLIEQVEVPAREAGVLATVTVREGALVEEDALLARIDDSEAQLHKRKAKLDLDAARLKAESDVRIRYAQKSSEVAHAELRRADESVRRFARSVSETELDRLRLVAERSDLEIEQAEEDFKGEQIQWQLMENEYALALRSVERRKILSPIAGVVVQVHRRRGEWVEPGETVMRLLRIDRLRAEGFLDAGDLAADLSERPVVLTVDLPGRPGAEFPGKVVFISPEVDPVDGRIRFWAEIDNHDLLLRPGQQARLRIELAEG